MRTNPYWRFGLGYDGVVVLFDVTNPDSFKECTESVSQYLKKPTYPLSFVLVGTHADKEAERQVKYEEAA